MTERSPDIATTTLLASLAALHVRMAAVITQIAQAADARNLLLRHDMQHNYETVAEEARELFEQANQDLVTLRTQIGDQKLPAEIAKTIDAIEDDLAHIKNMLPAMDADEEAGKQGEEGAQEGGG